jgi:hypothetical protein
METDQFRESERIGIGGDRECLLDALFPID